MAEEFTPITTQEQLDELLKQEQKSLAKKYEGWISPEAHQKEAKGLQGQIDTLTKENQGYKDTIAEQDASIKRYEVESVKSRVADEVGLDRRLVGRLSGDTEDDIRKDAEALKNLFGTSRTTFPLGEPEPIQKQPSKSALKHMLASLKGEN